MPANNLGWIGVDFDGTLSVYVGNFTLLGPPVPLMVLRVKQWIRAGHTVKIFTARISHKNPEKKAAVIAAIQEWCVIHIGQSLDVTNEKDFNCKAIYDDKAIQVIKNTGALVTKRGILNR